MVDAATAFADSLTDEQRELAVLDLSQDNAIAWSNLPCGQDCRGGVPLGDLDDDQKQLAADLLEAALGSGVEGRERVENIRLADEYLAQLQSGEATATSTTDEETADGATTEADGAAPTGGQTPPDGAMPGGEPADGTMPSGGPPGGGGGGGGGYGSDLYDLALLGDPSTDGTWILHFGGHHLAVNFTYADGEVVGPSPYFVGVEPTEWTGDDGTTYAPLADMADAVRAVTSSLSDEQLTSARLDDSFTDVLLGPGEDGQFPQTKSGLSVADLDDSQRQAVLGAMRAWVGITDDATAESTLADYESQLDETYIAYSGGTDLTAQGDYFRIDGPGVWIEFVCQNGVVVQNQIHYHTVWRDHERDYGGEFSFS